MISLSKISNIYFIGIGGIGMSALARYFNSLGIKVSGYDKTPSPLTNQLKNEGIDISFDDSIDTLDIDADLVVYTPAIPSNHLQYNWYKNKNYQLHKRSVVLGAITQNKFTIAVAGSHGKTSVSSMIAHLLVEMGYNTTAFLGGITKNYNSNYVRGNENSTLKIKEYKGDTEIIVVEADEFDRSFLTLHPNIAVLTSIDTDHLDIYGSFENIQKEFFAFIKQVNGELIAHRNIDIPKEVIKKHINYSLKDTTANFHTLNYTIKNGSQFFDLAYSFIDTIFENFKLNIGGTHNAENMLAALTALDYVINYEKGNIDVQIEKLRKAVSTFKGIKRRFDIQLAINNYIYIDDYAHHPEEIKALLTSVQLLFPKKNIVAIFQPHLFSRTQDLCAEFAEQLSKADDVILLPIYPARELPIEGVTSHIILDKINTKNKKVVEKEDLLNELKKVKKGSVVLTIGAGDIDRFVEPIKEILANE